MNRLLNYMKEDSNYAYTENGALTHKSSGDALYNLFSLAGSYRSRSDEDVLLIFYKAFEENPSYAMKCLFYLRDREEGCGERRFFRVVMRDLAINYPEFVRKNMHLIPEFGRWDDLYVFDDTSLAHEAYDFMYEQFKKDLNSNTPSLLGKWLASENASSNKTKKLAYHTRFYFGISACEYRKALSTLRSRINIIEKLMSQNRWDEIEFDKIPSRAGLIYRNAFRTREETKEAYRAFMENKETKVNASVLNPVDIAEKIYQQNGLYNSNINIPDIERKTFQKYWDNLKDYYNGREERGIAVCDVSGSMIGRPLYAAVSMSAYIAQRGNGPFKNHFITFSDNPKLVEFSGVDICDKFVRAANAEWGNSTNIEAVFDLLLKTALKHNLSQEDMPTRVYVFSDMEFNAGLKMRTSEKVQTLMEQIAGEWRSYGYELPSLIFWNLDARAKEGNFPALGERFSHVSGFSMNLVETILSGKTAMDLMYEKLNSERYKNIS